MHRALGWVKSACVAEAAQCALCAQLANELRQLGRSHFSSLARLVPAPKLLGGEFEG